MDTDKLNEFLENTPNEDLAWDRPTITALVLVKFFKQAIVTAGWFICLFPERVVGFCVLRFILTNWVATK